MKKIKIIAFGLFFLILPSLAHAEEKAAAPRKLIVFYSPGCHRCTQIKAEVLPEIEKRFAGRVQLEYRDIDDIGNYKLLLALEKSRNVKIKNSLPVFYFEGNFLNGEGRVRERLSRLISRTLVFSLPQSEFSLPHIDLIKRFGSFEPLAVMSAGLVDGINPCAFTVIVFFISFLALQGYRKKELAFIGLSFIISVFLTYLFIGIGIFGFLYRMKNFWLVARIFNISIGLLSIVFGVFALYDFYKFKKTGRTEGLALQLPPAVKNRIHSVIGRYYRKNKGDKAVISRPLLSLILAALATGFLVSILEAVCTGQVYLPTITFVLKTSPLKLQALVFLLLYNLMFILPLFVILILALFGTTSGQFSGFLKKQILTVKILMALLFFSLGIFLILQP
ncbi:MAG: hypothetical protein PHF11_08050 [Candidatus Omnitrophica bacterium]|nr:hypothetical protein [Candidatus Omnitrophota bacterium]